MNHFAKTVSLFACLSLTLATTAWSTPPAHMVADPVRGTITKFKMHKDNPTQVPIGKPIGLVFIGAALLFLPSILSVTSYTIFGSSGGTAEGPTGVVSASGG